MINKFLTIITCILICANVYLYINIYKEIKETEINVSRQIKTLQLTHELVHSQIQELDIIYTTAERYNIPPELALAMMKVESNFNTNAENNGCHGLMQVNSLYHTGDLFDLKVNVESSFSLLGSLIEESDNLKQALGKYNYGNAGFKRYVERTGTEVTAYSQKVLHLTESLQN
jgi:soluble lytic murein transglycosylase-like protein